MESNRIARRAEADQVVKAGKKREEDAMHRTWTEEAAGRLPRTSRHSPTRRCKGSKNNTQAETMTTKTTKHTNRFCRNRL